MDDLATNFILDSLERAPANGRQSSKSKVNYHCFWPARILLAVSLFSIVACASSGKRMANDSDSAARPSVGDSVTGIGLQPETTETYRGSEVPSDAISRKVAKNLVSGLLQVFDERALPAKIAIARPDNPFEYHLVEQLQLAGFSAFVANPAGSSQQLISYSIERVKALETNGSASNDSAGELFNNYSFQLSYRDFDLVRQYKVSTRSVQPVSPMWMRTRLTAETQLVRADDSEF